MSKITFKSLLFLVLAIMPMAFYAQNAEENQAKPNNNHYWYLGIDEGATLLFGDNKPGDFLKNVRPEIGIHGGYTFAKHFSAYVRVSAGTLKGELKNAFTVENASFLAYDLNLSADLVSLIWGYNPDRVFGLKPHVGFGQMMYQARINKNGEIVKVGYDDSGDNNLKGKGIGGRRVVWEVPFGIEFEFNLNRNCALYLDVATTYTDTDRLEAYAGGKHYDWFSAGLVGFRYKFRKADPADPCYTKEELDKEVEEALQKYQEENPAVTEEEIQKRIDDEVAKTREAMKAEENNSEAEVAYEAVDVNLEFEVGKAEVKDSDYNKNELKKISDDMEKGREINNIKVEGYASPEGNDADNNKLSQNRADAAVKYIKNGLGEDANNIKFESKGMGSDWAGLAEAVNNSNLTNKDEVLKVIEAKDTKALNALKEKTPELKNLLNALRRTEVFINE